MAAATVALVVAVLGACSGDDAGGDGDPDGGGGAVQLPTGADDVVLRLGGGPMPTLLIAGDGSVYELAEDSSSAAGWSASRPVRRAALGDDVSRDALRVGSVGRSRAAGYAAMAPAPTGPAPMTVRHLTEEGLQRVFQRADELGLLDTPPDYADVNVTDSGSTYLELRDVNGTYEHVADALGYDDEAVDDERQAFQDMVEDLADLDRLAGRSNLGDAEPYTPDTYQVTGDELVTPAGRSWPADVPLEEGCVELPRERFSDPVAGTYRYEGAATGDRIERVWVVPDLPGDDC